MTILMQRMREELVRRTYSETTIRSYLHAVEAFRQRAQKRLDPLGPDDLRREAKWQCPRCGNSMQINRRLTAREVYSLCERLDTS